MTKMFFISASTDFAKLDCFVEANNVEEAVKIWKAKDNVINISDDDVYFAVREVPRLCGMSRGLDWNDIPIVQDGTI